MADIVPTSAHQLEPNDTPKAEPGEPARTKRKRKSRSQRHKEKQQLKQQQQPPRPDYAPIVKDNANLVKYYSQQSILKQGEFPEFMNGLRETLPASFRINTFDKGQADFLRRLVEGPQFQEFLSVASPASKEANDDQQAAEPDGQPEASKSAVLEPLVWYPNHLAWHMNITRLDLKKSPTLQQLHKFLMAETDNGFISRQEAVSMIPPLILDVQRGQDVLDMCAAPGSKTAQLLEYLKHPIMDDAPQTAHQSPHPFDDGLVVANDVDNKRCYMLVHQSSRLNSPNCVIINQDASRLPEMEIVDGDKDQRSVVKFDRVLCDVPCSGDGTVRKNPDVWKKWSVGNANNFHGMQCKILRRGIELLKENGLLVYSTCSMNPVEDEAVIASILRASQGRVVLEDAAHKLPGLKYRPGTSDWVVMNREMEVIPSADKVPAENASQIYPSLFPPSEEEAKLFCLERCIRILPHFQNTGGFFVALLRKTAAVLPWEEVVKEEKPVKTDETEQQPPSCRVPPPNPKKRRFAGFKEDPFIFVDENDTDWINIRTVYGLSDKFPLSQLVHRCSGGKKRTIYLVSRKTRGFIQANSEEPGKRDFVKIINGGMRLFSRADTGAGFRICQDGVSEILPYIRDDIKVPINKDDLVNLLKSRAVGFDLLSCSQHVKDKIKPGSFILIYRHESQDGGESFEMPLVAWKGEWTVALYVANTYRVHLLALAQLKIGDDCSANQSETKQPIEEQ